MRLVVYSITRIVTFVAAGLMCNTLQINFGVFGNREFLLNLNHRQKWFQRQRNAQKDDVVLSVDDT